MKDVARTNLPGRWSGSRVEASRDRARRTIPSRGRFSCPTTVTALVLFVSALGAAAAPARPPSLEQASFEFADTNLTVELVAAEPDVVSPVAMAWDADGRLFVAEMRDYPNATNGGSIRRLEDRDGDGRYETATLFAEGLSFPNSVLPWNGGVLVTAAPDLIFLADGDGDGRADERRVLLTGFGTGNQQLRANGLAWGFDGWVYGANGRSDGQVHRPGATNVISLRGRDFRFRPETGEIETLAGRSQFGLALDDWGGRFLSWNTIPARHEVLPDRYLAANELTAGQDVLADLLPAGDSGEVYPATPAPRVFNNESASHFNALSGLTLYRGDALGSGYRGNLFVGESLRNLVHRRVLAPAGATYVARRGEERSEFLRAADPWFHPVNFATGPDGALYVADFYREFVEHPDWVPREMRDRVPWQTGREHGRIWRVVPRRARSTQSQPPPRGASPSALATLGSAALVGELDHTNSWRRETAQRLIIERRDRSVIAQLRQLVRAGVHPQGRFLAGQTLAAFSAVDADDVVVAMKGVEPGLRRWALGMVLQWNAPTLPVALENAVVARAADDDARVRLWAALALRRVMNENHRETALRRLIREGNDRWIRLAAISSSSSIGKEEAIRLLAGSARSLRPAPVLAVPDPDRQKVIERLQPALKLGGDRRRGAAHFSKLCLPCHYVQGHGARVGPDLSGISARPAEALLVDVLDPSRQIAPEYAAYEIMLTNGEVVAGLFASETETRLTLRRPGTPDENVSRDRVRAIRATGKSLMPDGLEAGWSPQDLADLLAFLRQPDGELLSP